MIVLNHCSFIGNLGQDPDVRFMPNGEAVVNLSVACSEKWKDKQGQMQEHTEWVRISFFGAVAENAGKYLKKGSKVYASGKLRTRKYQAQDGTDRYATEIRGEQLKFLDSKSDSRPQQQEQAAPTPAPAPEYDDADIPF